MLRDKGKDRAVMGRRRHLQKASALKRSHAWRDPHRVRKFQWSWYDDLPVVKRTPESRHRRSLNRKRWIRVDEECRGERRDASSRCLETGEALRFREQLRRHIEAKRVAERSDHDLSGFERRFADRERWAAARPTYPSLVAHDRRHHPGRHPHSRRRYQSGWQVQLRPADAITKIPYSVAGPVYRQPSMLSPPWVRVENTELKRRIVAYFGVHPEFAKHTVIVCTQQDVGCFPGHTELPNASLNCYLRTGYWTKVSASEERCLVVQEDRLSFQRSWGRASKGFGKRAGLFSPKAFVAAMMQFRHSVEDCYSVALPLKRLASATMHTVRSSHTRYKEFKTHAGWGHIAMAGMTFRPGNGRPGMCCGPWLYNSWAHKFSDSAKAELTQAVVEGVNLDWQWFETNFPPKCQELERIVNTVSQHVEMAYDGSRRPLCLGNSKWSCLSIGVQYHAAPHVDPIDLGGAVIRFTDVGRGEIAGNEFVLPELGVVLETPSMSVVWAQTDRVRHGTMAAQRGSMGGTCVRVATARQMKKTLLTYLFNKQRNTSLHSKRRLVYDF